MDINFCTIDLKFFESVLTESQYFKIMKPGKCNLGCSEKTSTKKREAKENVKFDRVATKIANMHSMNAFHLCGLI